MTLRPEQIARWVAENGPWLFQRCTDEEAARVLAGDTGLAPHPDCAYIGTVRYLESDCPLRVDIRRLDPEAIVVDENQVALNPHDFRRGRASLGEAIHRLDLDSPENVWRSLEKGSVGVRGGVPREAVEPAY